VPTFIWICPNYVEGHLNIDTVWVWFFVFISSGIVISLIAYPFLFLMVRNGMRPTSFNKVVFPLCVIGIAWAFGCIYYLAIVRYWTTIVILLVVVAGCDIMAYFAGVLFGKHRMAPVISPKKSWEGAIIGAIAAAGLAVLFIYFH
jgi:phosphatidate cytidylyltransferase